MRTVLALPVVAAVVLTASACGGAAADSEEPAGAAAYPYLESISEIAGAHGGNRAVGSNGGRATRDYIVEELEQMGYQPRTQPVTGADGDVGANILADTGGSGRTVILGAHYDSVKQGPGINDNGSGVATVLAIGERLRSTRPDLNVRLAFWDSEEYGIAGSQTYVKSMSPAEMKSVVAYINADMTGTREPTAMVYDADGSSAKRLADASREDPELARAIEALMPPKDVASEKLEATLRECLGRQNIPVDDDLSLNGSTDTAPFVGRVPVGGAVLVHEVTLPDNVLQFAPGYHSPGDTIDTVDADVLERTTDAMWCSVLAVSAGALS
ncbi:M20/M25/M40 family metallo-hydrolase [Gordonia amicalis]|uniref:M28 family peptidase n=1 Tax=Gordonia amicalis TaxID=89053 RepID=UPI0029557AD9|nr:M28 family peptidase [Gordonia amicalis]MDV7098836.1 M20/M25/M40 family metallo-hydrolase [Gordonia amicalis]